MASASRGGCEELELHLAYRWFCRLDLDDKVPDHSTFSVNRHGRFRDSDILRQVFEAVVRACMGAGLVKGEGFAVDASAMEANASRYRGKAPLSKPPPETVHHQGRTPIGGQIWKPIDRNKGSGGDCLA
jgi:transposase